MLFPQFYKTFGSNDLNAIQAPSPPLILGPPPPEIDFFDVLDDLEQKKNIFFVQKSFFWT